ncbi:ribulose-phosphate 3-epimerase [Herbiconiux daphne]|uniref:Ribulose-phosphate 3-epimerase n=1 Tax=Herbiconiux daphne TaxID=2970914 RepID=A0ABT2H5R8_9MICO|nr:ribulose-phosphate 3-epimerase [Herbiconiux daphne]MCS5735266.1 ribulose-phosphate 3-epimerase [Herbiconiux daphne]
MAIRIHPSILAADFLRLGDELARVADADMIHVDVMDYHFVPNLSFGLPVVERLVAGSPLPLDVHLMVDDPARWAGDYAEAGAHSVTFHAEAAADPVDIARGIRRRGARAGLAIKPGTPIEPYLPLLDEVDMVLVMTVEPGFGGQSFLASTMPKLRRLREAVDATGLDVWVQVDGGINEDTIGEAADAGANTFVAGSSVFGAEHAGDQLALLRARAAQHAH